MATTVGKSEKKELRRRHSNGELDVETLGPRLNPTKAARTAYVDLASAIAKHFRQVK